MVSGEIPNKNRACFSLNLSVETINSPVKLLLEVIIARTSYLGCGDEGARLTAAPQPARGSCSLGISTGLGIAIDPPA